MAAGAGAEVEDPTSTVLERAVLESGQACFRWSVECRNRNRFVFPEIAGDDDLGRGVAVVVIEQGGAQRRPRGCIDDAS